MQCLHGGIVDWNMSYLTVAPHQETNFQEAELNSHYSITFRRFATDH